jgi:hypothetical protein
MKVHKLLFVLSMLSILIGSNAFSQTELVGTWQGVLTIDKENRKTIQFILVKKADGSYSAVLNSPDTGDPKNVAASSVKYSGGKITIDVSSYNGSYSGTVGKDSITGEWRQQGSSLPLVLDRYKKPEAGSFKPLLGEWSGLLTAPGTKVTIIFRFETAKDGKLVASMDVPEQGAKGISASDVLFVGDGVSLKIPVSGIEYIGKLSGNEIKGTFKQSGGAFELNLTKGKYEPPSFALAPEDMKRLLGTWIGKWKVDEPTPRTVIWKFEKTKNGKMAGSAACPEISPQVAQITELSLKGDQISIKISGAGEYAGKLSGNSMSGEYKVEGRQFPISVARGASHTQADVSAEILKQLLGQWSGKIETTGSYVVYVLRFDMNKNGKLVGYFDCAENSQKDLLVTYVSFTNNQIKINVPAFNRAEYNGKLNNGRIAGDWILNGSGGPKIEFVKGQYEPESDVAPESKDAMKALLGRWTGVLNGPLAFRFKLNAKGNFIIHMDPNPSNQPDVHLLVRKVSFANGELSLVVPGPSWTYKAKVKGNKMEGTFNLSGSDRPLVLTRESAS